MQADNKTQFWYNAINNKLIRHTNYFEDFKEITSSGEVLDIDKGTYKDGLWTKYEHKVFYVNSSTDDWFDLVYRFLYCPYFVKMYVNNKKDVIMVYNFSNDLTDFYMLEYMAWKVRAYSVSDIGVIITNIVVPRDGFCVLLSNDMELNSVNKNNIKQMLTSFRKVVSNRDYKTKKMIKGIIEGNTISIVNRLYDVNIMCCL